MGFVRVEVYVMVDASDLIHPLTDHGCGVILIVVSANPARNKKIFVNILRKEEMGFYVPFNSLS